MLDRRKFLGVVAAGVGAAGYARYWEPAWLEETETRVPVGAGRLRRPLRIAHLSDLHASLQVPMDYLGYAMERAAATRPDLICLTGDFITTANDIDVAAYERVLRRLTAAAPTFAVFGNHDGGSWAANSGWLTNHNFVEEILVRAGVQPLHNRNQTVETGAGRVRLVGLGDWWSDECLPESGFAGLPEEEGPIVVLNHNPDGKQECLDREWHLMLSGHTHGGQIRWPFGRAISAPVLDRRFVEGLNPLETAGRERRWIFTTRGIGNVLGIRFNCRPELSRIVLG